MSRTVFHMQERGEDILTASDGKTRRYLDFIDVLLEARVSLVDNFLVDCVAMTPIRLRMMKGVVSQTRRSELRLTHFCLKVTTPQLLRYAGPCTTWPGSRTTRESVEKKWIKYLKRKAK